MRSARGWRAAMRAVAEYANVPDQFRPVVRLGIDETVSRCQRRFVTHLVDLDTGTVIATVQCRSAAVLLQALAAQGPEWLARVEQVAIDPFTPRPRPSATCCPTPFRSLTIPCAPPVRSCCRPGPATANRRIATLRGLFEFAVLAGERADSPVPWRAERWGCARSGGSVGASVGAPSPHRRPVGAGATAAAREP